MFTLFILGNLLLLISLVETDSNSCERDKCRTVRKVIYQELIPHFKSIGAKIPYNCPFFKDRDKYITQEEHKERESASRWSCGYCGKSFIGEIYIDAHFNNRHADSIYNEPDAVCLSDFCELFRCDVLMGVAKPSFWDLALCMEEDMLDLTQDCTEFLTGCVPESLNWNASKTLTAAMSQSVCSFLTCKKYYDAPLIQEEVPVRTPYVVFSVLLSVALIIYYCVVVNYFWLDTFSDVSDTEEHIERRPESLFSRDFPRTSHRARKKPNFIQSEASRGHDDIFNVRGGLADTLQSVSDTER